LKFVQELMDSEIVKKIRKSDIFETIKHSANYFSATIAVKAIGFISVPIFTRLLTQTDYGIIAIFSAYVGIFTIILSLDSYTAVGRYYYEGKDDFNEFIGTTLVFAGLIFGVSVFVYLLLYGHITALMELPGPLLIYLIFACFFSIVYTIYYQILVPQKRSKEAAVISTVRGYSVLGVSVLFVYLLEENRYVGYIWATLLIGTIFSVYFLVKMFNFSKLSLNSHHIRYIISFSIPLLPYHLSSIILAQFDRIMVSTIVDTASAGLYSLGYTIGSLLLIVISSTQTAVIPDFFKFLNKKEYTRLDRLVKRVFSIIAVVALGLILFAREIVFVLADEKFHPGLSVVPVVVVGYLFYGMFSVYIRYIAYTKKTVYSSIAAITAGVSNIALNALFIPVYGYIAAAYTTVVSYFIMFFLSWLAAKFILKQKMTPLWVVWKPTLIVFMCAAAVYGLDIIFVNAFLFSIMKVAVLLLCGIAVFWREIRVLCLHMFCKKV
jgi:O-antigen/teichoic acid export membrane protein